MCSRYLVQATVIDHRSVLKLERRANASSLKALKTIIEPQDSQPDTEVADCTDNNTCSEANGRATGAYKQELLKNASKRLTGA